MKKAVKTLLIILAVLLGIVIIAVGGLNIYFRASVPDFYKRAVEEGNIPGLSEGFIPQGLTYVPEEELFVTCGYMNDGSASRIYICNENSDYVLLSDASGGDDNTHTGGLAYWNEYVFLTHDSNIAVYNWNDIKKLSAANNKKIAPIASFGVDFEAAFCCIKDDSLYVGEFYREESYPTSESHHIKTDSGDSHHAVLCVYDLKQIKASNFVEAKPIMAYSIVDLAQGMCFTDNGNICISTSWGLSFSHIYVYNDPVFEAADSSIEINNTEVPLYYLDSAHRKEDISLVPMCEELYFMNGRIFFTNESASSKYIFGKLTGGDKVFSLDIG